MNVNVLNYNNFDEILIIFNYQPNMVPIITLMIVGVILGMVSLIFLWKYITFRWLNIIATALVISLPFERIPSVDIGAITIRTSQIIVLFGMVTLIILIIKRDETLFKLKITPLFLPLLGFVVLSIPSWFFVLNDIRFVTTTIATWIAFLAAFFISQFLESFKTAFLGLITSLTVSSLFGFYQFAGDLIGLPTTLTGLRGQYTSVVFGFPRPHSTALEPLYFAGMLFFPIFTCLIFWLGKKPVFPFYKFPIFNLVLVVMFLLIFLLTFSKSAIVILGAMLVFMLSVWLIKFPSIQTVLSLLVLVGLGIFFVYGANSIFPVFANSLETALTFFIDTIALQTSTADERTMFLEAAFLLLPFSILLGIGSGQFGVYADPILKFITQREPGYFIVNNVYLEIWLEHGFLALLAFLFILFLSLKDILISLLKLDSWESDEVLLSIGLLLSLGAYFTQWLTFSPIYIMPIFILIGFSVKLGERMKERITN